MRVVPLILIVLGHFLALLATAWRAALAWGPMEGGPGWRPEVAVGIAVTALLAVVMLVAAWKVVQGRASLRSDAVGLAASALGLGVWVQFLHASCNGLCRSADEDMNWVGAAVFAAPGALMALYCVVLAGIFLRRIWRRSAEPLPGAGPLASASDEVQAAPSPAFAGLRSLRPLRPATAVLVGAAVGNGMGYASSYLTSMAILWALVKLGMTAQDAHRWMSSSPATLAPLTLVGLWGLAFGGYWTARLQPMTPFKSAGLAGILMMTLTGVAQIKLRSGRNFDTAEN